MSELNLYRVTPRVTRQYVEECLSSGLVPYVTSSPGLGKSSIAKLVAKQFNLLLIDYRLSGAAPEDQTGLPRFNQRGFAEHAAFEDIFPLEGTPLPKDENGHEYDGWLLLLDEFNSATRLVLASCYKLLLDRMVGQKKLHPNVAMMLAGNLGSDRALVNPIGTALESRVVHIEMMASFDEWLYDVALKENYDPRVIAFLSQNNNRLMDFKPDHQDKTFCCPRKHTALHKRNLMSKAA
ncbi:MAG: hypothetical protein WC117_00260 [Sphaerochaetaceae bacterium]|jgi:hypothetical protein